MASSLEQVAEEVVVSEQTPLLRNDHDSNAGTTTKDTNQPRTPFPKLQLATVFLIQFCEPITAIVIYSFVNQFVRSTGITGGDEKATGYYAGIIESLFFWTEGVTAIPWQVASDRWGRRPVMLLAPLGLGLSMIGFGWTKNFWLLVLFRGFQGVFNGDVGVSKTVLGEITDDTNRAETVAMIPAMWSIASTLAPFIGGFFSSPAENWPDTLGKIEFFQTNPYFLPCAISGAICFVAFFLAFIGLKESSPAALHKQKRLASSPSDTPDSMSQSEHEELSEHLKPPPIRKVLTRPILLPVITQGLFAMTSMFCLALQPLIWSTSIQNGGLGFSAYTIGLVNTIFGIPNAIIQIFFLGPLLRRYGPRAMTILAVSSCVVCLALFPLQTYLAKVEGGVDWKVWVVIAIQLASSTLVSSGYGALLVFLVTVSPTPGSLGTIQGLAQTVSVACRGLAPWIATSLFAFSKEHEAWAGGFGGYLVYLVLGIVTVWTVRVSCALPTI